MAAPLFSTSKVLRRHITFDRAINGGVILFVVVILSSFILVAGGLVEWVGRQTDLATLQDGDAAVLDTFFIILYTAIALLYAQNLLFFYQTRERVYLTYCLYVTFMAVHVVLYGQLESLLGMPLPVPISWNAFTSLTAHNISMVFIFRFARQLLNSEQLAPKIDLLFKMGMVFALIPNLIAYFGNDEIFYVFDSISTLVFGAVILIGSLSAARQGNTAARILFFSYLAQYVGFFWSYVIYVFPDMAPVFNPFYADRPFMAESSIWISALFVEALLMSMAAQQYVRVSKAATVEATDRAERLERAIHLAKAHLADQARASTVDRETSKVNREIKSPDRVLAKQTPSSMAAGLREIIKSNAAESFVDVTFLASAAATSKATLLRRLKEETGLSPNGFIRQVRLDMAHGLLSTGTVKTIHEALALCGFSHQGHFTERYTESFGESPVETIKAAKNSG